MLLAPKKLASLGRIGSLFAKDCDDGDNIQVNTQIKHFISAQFHKVPRLMFDTELGFCGAAPAPGNATARCSGGTRACC